MLLDRSLYKETPVHSDSDNPEPCPPCSSSSVVLGIIICRLLSVDVVVAVGVGVDAGKSCLIQSLVVHIPRQVAAFPEGEVSGLERKEEEKGGSCRLIFAIEEDDACCRVMQWSR